MGDKQDKSSRRGWKRLWIALFGSWAVFWTAYGWVAAHTQQVWYDELFRYTRQSNMDMIAFASQNAAKWGDRLTLCVQVGGGGFILGLIALALGMWVYRGFVPKTRT